MNDTRYTKLQNEAINGIGNTPLNEIIPNYNEASSEHVIQGKNNTYIVLGRDRPTDIFSGYGGRGAIKAGSIDIVAGRVSAVIKTVDDKGNKVFTEPSMEYDASRILVSQRTDVDKNFYLPGTGVINKAAIAIKSDNVRIIAREKIKLVTNIDKFDSNGELKIQLGGVELFATDGKELQPMVKGSNLSEVINDIYDKIGTNTSELANIYRLLLTLCNGLAAHIHVTSFGPTAPSIELAAVSSIIGAEAGMHTISNQMHHSNLQIAKINYLTPGSIKYINSLYHKLD